MKASIHQAGIIKDLKEGNSHGKSWLSFALSTAHNADSVTYHNYIMGGKLADFWSGRIQDGDLVTVEANATQTVGDDNRKWLSWSVENFNFEGFGLPDNALQFCEVTLKGMVKQLRQSSGFFTFGCGCKPPKSKSLIFFNVSMGKKLFDAYPIQEDDKVLLKVHMEPRKKGSETYYNWYIDKIVKLGHGFIKARDPVSKSVVDSSAVSLAPRAGLTKTRPNISPSAVNPAFTSENPYPFG
jgi:hypothetical protein